MEIINLYPGSFGSNCYLLLSDGHAAVIDPSANAQKILSAVSERGAVLDFILLTHGHFDHMLSLSELKAASNAPVYIHEADADMPEDTYKNAFYYFFHRERTYPTPDRTVKDGDVLTLGSTKIRVIHTPGHTMGSCCFLCDGDVLITGDTLFEANFGRYDLYGGDEATLFHSLRSLKEHPPQLEIYPGHGATARLGDALERVLFFDN